jgi:hypothetical protein
MAAQEQAVEKRGFSLRELKILQRVFERVGLSRHCRKPQFTHFAGAVKYPVRERAHNFKLNLLGQVRDVALNVLNALPVSRFDDPVRTVREGAPQLFAAPWVPLIWLAGRRVGTHAESAGGCTKLDAPTPKRRLGSPGPPRSIPVNPTIATRWRFAHLSLDC